jgi:site-specific DNA recombinase
MRTAIYIRVSTEEQAKEGYSVDAQKRRLTDFVNSQGWEVYDTFIDDGYSAKNLERPNMQRLIQAVKQKAIDVVLVYKLDRLVRSVIDLHELLELFEKYDVKFKSATEIFDTTTAIGRLFITIVAALAQWERENLAERVKMGMEQKHLKGERNGAVAPYGYDLVNGELVINPVEAQVVRRIFEMYRTKGIKQIVTQLNKEQAPKRGDFLWVYFTVNYILSNPVYCGKLRWNNRKQNGRFTGEEIIVDGNHPPIISVEEFEEAQRLRKMRQKEGKRSTSVFTYSGVLRCGRCNRSMIGFSKPRKNDRKLFYRCTGRFNYGICDMPLIAEESITEALLSRLEINIDEEVQKQIALPTTEQDKDTEDIRTMLESELESIAKRKKKWQIAFANDAITIEELKSLTEEDRKREEFIKQQLLELPHEKERSTWTVEELIQALHSLKDNWYQLDDTTRKMTISELYDSIVINTDVIKPTGGPGKRVPVEIIDWSFKS